MKFFGWLNAESKSALEEVLKNVIVIGTIFGIMLMTTFLTSYVCVN